MEYLDTTYFSEEQLWIVEKKVFGCSYQTLTNRWASEQPFPDYPALGRSAIHACLRKSALSLQWKRGESGGRYPLLGRADIDELIRYIQETAEDATYIDVEATADKAAEIRLSRIANGERFLDSIGCFSLKNEISTLRQTLPNQHWVYDNIESLQACLRSPRTIELNRIEACTPNNIRTSHATLKEALEGVPQALIFGADESMLQPISTKRKVVVPNQFTGVPTSVDMPTLPHLTAMCVHNTIGVHFPLFIILAGLSELPDDLIEFETNNEAKFSSNQKGWQTRDTFLWFVICFINWLSDYRLQLGSEVRGAPACLIVDGHGSRVCPLALILLREHNIRLYVLAAHTSHVCQMFDVGIAAQFKSYFSTLVQQSLSSVDGNQPLIPQLRRIVVKAAITAWSEKCTKAACQNAARKAGTFPTCVQPLLDSPDVNEFTPALQTAIASRRTRNAFININSSIIPEYSTI